MIKLVSILFIFLTLTSRAADHLVTCENNQLTVHASSKDPSVLQVVVRGQLREALQKAGDFLDGFVDMKHAATGEIVSAAEGRHFDWHALRSGKDFQGMFVTGYNYLTNIYQNNGKFYIKVIGSLRPGCVTMPDGERVCYGSGEWIEKKLPLKACDLL